ncbi:dihydroxyacetone kinase family protein [Microbacterium sp. RD1]|uniref:dihydroxyacetone kinase family protein n=1 Tax=Microbacterium sp. RD1 TaxID=3457313 RepID=UPI003FA5A28A
MTSVIDTVERFADDAIDGLVEVYGRYVRRVDGGVVRAATPEHGRVVVVIGGGSGHYPAFAGLVGAGLAAGAVCGNVFTSPSAGQAYRVARAANAGGGVLFSYGNYAGDVLHFGLAAERLTADGIDVRTVLVTDDIASAPAGEEERRRGIAGDFVVFKVAGAAADRGDDLDEVERLARLANARTRTLGVAFSGCSLPGAEGPLFSVPEGTMSIGLGIHGEPGIRDVPLASASDLAEQLVSALLAERPEDADGRVGVIVNGLGSVSYEELFVVFRAAAALLREAGLELVDPECGELVTSLDMGGLSLTLVWLDDELDPLWRAAAATPAYRKGAIELPRAHPEPGSDHLPSVDAAVRPESEAMMALAPAIVAAGGRVRAVLQEHEEELGRIDAYAGDGDHGIGMVRGITAFDHAARDIIARHGGAFAALTGGAEAWSERAGGTSGALWAAALTAAARALREADASVETAVVRAVESALAAVQRLGGAQVGDKTMVDAFAPFAGELRRRSDAGESLASAWSGAVTVAEAAAQSTASLRPRLGRARPLAEKSVGHPDAGAVSFTYIVAALADIRGES